ncbi:MAG: DUF3221 domain-containing protein [Christensenellales bacterium]|jgi:hypothetical protein
MKRIRVILFVMAAAVIFAAGCANVNLDGGNAPAEVIGIRGSVMNITSGEGAVTILVEGNVEEDTQFDKASVTVSRHTAVTKEGDVLSYNDIRIGDVVEVIFDGPVAESYPVQGAAKSVKILDE